MTSHHLIGTFALKGGCLQLVTIFWNAKSVCHCHYFLLQRVPLTHSLAEKRQQNWQGHNLLAVRSSCKQCLSVFAPVAVYPEEKGPAWDTCLRRTNSLVHLQSQIGLSKLLEVCLEVTTRWEILFKTKKKDRAGYFFACLVCGIRLGESLNKQQASSRHGARANLCPNDIVAYRDTAQGPTTHVAMCFDTSLGSASGSASIEVQDQ